MTHMEFQVQIDRLRNCFGDRAYTEERVKLMWYAVRDLENYWWTRTTDRFIGDFKFPPLLPELRDEIAKERDRLWEKRKTTRFEYDPRINCECQLCGDTGVIIARHMQDFAPYAFKCQCSAGRSDPRPYVYWSPGNSEMTLSQVWKNRPSGGDIIGAKE